MDSETGERAGQDCLTDLTRAAHRASAKNSDPLLTVKQVAEWLNYKPKTIYDWAAQRRIPCLRLGGGIRFERNAILRWLGRRKEGE